MADLSDLRALEAKINGGTSPEESEEFVQPLISEDFINPKDEARVKGLSLLEEDAGKTDTPFPLSLFQGDAARSDTPPLLEVLQAKEDLIGIENPLLDTIEGFQGLNEGVRNAGMMMGAGAVGGLAGKLAPSLLFPNIASKAPTLIGLTGEAAGTNLATQAYSQDFTNDRPTEEVLELLTGASYGAALDMGIGLGAKVVGGIGKGITSVGENYSIGANRPFNKEEMLKDAFPDKAAADPDFIMAARQKISKVMDRITNMGDLTPDGNGRFMPEIRKRFKTLQGANHEAYAQSVDTLSKFDNQKVASIDDLFDWKKAPEQDSAWDLEYRSLREEARDPLSGATKAKSFEALMREETQQKARVVFKDDLIRMDKILGDSKIKELGLTEDKIRQIDISKGKEGILSVIDEKDVTPGDLKDAYQQVSEFLALDNKVRTTKIFNIKDLHTIRTDYSQRASSEYAKAGKGTLNEGEAKKARALYQSSAMIDNRIEERVKELQKLGTIDEGLAKQYSELKTEAHEILATEDMIDQAWKINEKYVPEGVIARTTGYLSSLMRRDPVGLSVRLEDIPKQQKALKALANWGGGTDKESQLIANLLPTATKILGGIPTETTAYFTPTNINSISNAITEINKTVATISADPNMSPSDISVLSSLKSLSTSLDGARQKAFEGMDLPEEDQENILVSVFKDPFAKRVLLPQSDDVNPFAKGLSVINNRLPDLRDREIYVDRVRMNDGLSNVQKSEMIQSALETGKISQATAYQYSLQKRFESGYSKKPKQESSGSAYDRSVRNQISNLLESK